MGDRMQHIFGLLAIHTTPIGHRVSETGDNSVSVLYTRDGTCVQQQPSISTIPFSDLADRPNISRGI